MPVVEQWRKASRGPVVLHEVGETAAVGPKVLLPLVRLGHGEVDDVVGVGRADPTRRRRARSMGTQRTPADSSRSRAAASRKRAPATTSLVAARAMATGSATWPVAPVMTMVLPPSSTGAMGALLRELGTGRCREGRRAGRSYPPSTVSPIRRARCRPTPRCGVATATGVGVPTVPAPPDGGGPGRGRLVPNACRRVRHTRCGHRRYHRWRASRARRGPDVDTAVPRGPYWSFRQFPSGGHVLPGRRRIALAVDQRSQP